MSYVINKRHLTALLPSALIMCVVLGSGVDVWAATEEKAAGWGHLEFLGRIVNLLILVGILIYFLRKPVAQFFTSRSEEIKKSLAEAQRARDEATAKLAEMEKKMRDLDSEVNQIRALAEKEASEERERTIKSAQEDAEKIKSVAKNEIENLTRSARKELRSYAAELSVSLAKEKIEREIGPEDEAKLFTRFISKMRGLK